MIFSRSGRRLVSNDTGGAPPGYGYYASPSGSSTAAGTIGDPWDLQTGLDGGYPGGTVIQPGDTLWLRGGTYTTTVNSGTFGIYNSHLVGTLQGGYNDPTGKITVRSYPGETAVLDGNPYSGNPSGVFSFAGDYTWVRDVVFTNSIASPPEYGFGGVCGSTGNRVGNKLINCVMHDNTGAGIGGSLTLNTNFECYGSILYFNGRSPAPATSPPENAKFDYAMYLANNTGTKYITKNIALHNMGGMQIQCYSQTAGNLNGFVFAGNTIATHHYMTAYPERGWFWAGSSASDLENFTFTRNYVHGAGAEEGLIIIESDGAFTATSPIITDNLMGQGIAYVGSATAPWNVTGLTCTGNKIYGQYTQGYGFTTGAYPSNDWYQGGSAPSVNWVGVEANDYEVGRANLTVFNWTSATSQAFDVSGVLSNGDNWEVRKAENFFGSAVASGTNYSGGTISVPLTDTTVATCYGAPSGRSQPTSTLPLFGAFVLRKT